MEKIDVDLLLKPLGGWGKFQIFYYLSMCSVVIFSVLSMSFIFVARNLKYRCEIESCIQDQYGTTYNPEWLNNAVPYKSNVPSRCHYYKPLLNSTCTQFNQSEVLTCNKFVFETNQTTIVQDFNIYCEENIWKLTTAGSLSAAGELVSLPFAGYISDRYGRKVFMLFSVIVSTGIGLLRSYSVNYEMYLSLEFLDTAFSAGAYSAAFISALEIIEPQRRSAGNLIICCAFTLGQILLALAAWITDTWRSFLRLIYMYGFIVVILIWFSPESIRWLVAKRKIVEARRVVTIITRFNTIEIEEDIICQLTTFTEPEESTRKKDKKELPLLAVLKSRILLLRIVHCSFTWICCNFPYYGLTIHSVGLSEHTYINFMLQAIIEIPAYILTSYLIEKFGRRKTLGLSFILAGVFCVCVNIVPEGTWWSLITFLCGKFFITIAYTTTYIYTTEMFPTEARHSAFSICSMCGRIGSMMAPQIYILDEIFQGLALILFASMTVVAGLLAFLFPETHNINLPDQVHEAEQISRTKRRDQQ